MKAQAVNIDWVVGLSVFLVAVIASTVNVVESADITLGTNLESKAAEVADSIQMDASTDVTKIPLYVRQPHDVGRIPVDRSISIRKEGTAYVSTESWVNKSSGDVVAVVSSGNNSYSLTSFGGNVSHSFDSNVSGGETLENNLVSVEPENGDLASITFEEENYLESDTDLGESGSSTEVYGVHGSVFDRVNVYTGSREIIVEDVDTTFHFGNFSTLHEEDGSETAISGEQTFMDGQTQGFALTGLRGTDLSASLVGDMDARVYQDGDTGTKVDVQSQKLRLMLHESGESAEQRVENRVSGEIYFGARQQLSAATGSELERIESMTWRQFEREYGLRSFGYNVSGTLDRGENIPLQPVSVESRPVPKAYWNGTVEWMNLRVAVWQ